MFYNGTAEQPERKILKLSDAYEKFIEEPELELKVLMLNINQGKNRDIMEKCRVLREYMLFVARVREYAAVDGIEHAVNRAVNECIREGILKEFLLKNKAEAIQMSIFEYDEEREKELLKKAYLEEGEARGRQIGEEVGEARGRRIGEEVGEARGKVECILTVLSEKGEVPDSIREQVCVQQDSKTLMGWLKLALKADTVEEFRQRMNEQTV